MRAIARGHAAIGVTRGVADAVCLGLDDGAARHAFGQSPHEHLADEKTSEPAVSTGISARSSTRIILCHPCNAGLFAWSRVRPMAAENSVGCMPNRGTERLVINLNGPKRLTSHLTFRVPQPSVVVNRFGDAVRTTTVTGRREISSGDAQPVIHDE